jgi:DNA polymerase III subunit epsilon
MFAIVPPVPASDLATPLHDVTFCVVDLETTGASPADCTITEVGAAKFQGGECLGTFQTLVNPGVAIPPFITLLTGITQAMVGPAPPIREVMPALLEFVGRSVLVGHNVRFDISFLDAALLAGDRGRLGLPTVDTVALARRLVGEDDDVFDCRLGTLATRFGLPHQPTHRALDDVLATADLLHLLLERAGPLGVTALDDLLRLPAVTRRPYAAKLRLTAGLPRSPGLYLFRDGQGRPLYADGAPDLRTRVRSLFTVRSGPAMRTIGAVLQAAHSLEHVVCTSALEAAVLAVRVVQALTPRFNRSGRWAGYRYVRGVGGSSPRVAVARRADRAGPGWLGPLPSTRTARTVVDALTASLGDGAAAVAGLEAAVGGDADAVVVPLRRRAQDLGAAGAHEEAAAAWEGAGVVAAALHRHHRRDALRRADRMVVELPGGAGAELCRGRLVRAWGPVASGDVGGVSGPGRQSHGRAGVVAGWGGVGLAELCGPGGAARPDAAGVGLPPAPDDGPVPADMVDELDCVASWLDRHGGEVRRVHVDGVLTGVPTGAEPRAGPGGSAAVLAAAPAGLRCRAC